MGKKKEKRIARKEKAKQDYMDIMCMFRGMSRKECKFRAKYLRANRLHYYAAKNLQAMGITFPKTDRLIETYEKRIEQKKAEGRRKMNLAWMMEIGEFPVPDEMKNLIYEFAKM
jgi:hypothetical protein